LIRTRGYWGENDNKILSRLSRKKNSDKTPRFSTYVVSQKFCPLVSEQTFIRWLEWRC